MTQNETSTPAARPGVSVYRHLTDDQKRALHTAMQAVCPTPLVLGDIRYITDLVGQGLADVDTVVRTIDPQGGASIRDAQGWALDIIGATLSALGLAPAARAGIEITTAEDMALRFTALELGDEMHRRLMAGAAVTDDEVMALSKAYGLARRLGI